MRAGTDSAGPRSPLPGLRGRPPDNARDTATERVADHGRALDDDFLGDRRARLLLRIGDVAAKSNRVRGGGAIHTLAELAGEGEHRIERNPLGAQTPDFHSPNLTVPASNAHIKVLTTPSPRPSTAKRLIGIAGIDAAENALLAGALRCRCAGSTDVAQRDCD